MASFPPFLSVHDPPWNADDGGGGKGANAKYDTMKSVEDYAWQVRMSPPWRDTGPGLMFMWSTVLAFNTGDAAQLVRALDFRISAHFIWWKADVCEDCDGEGVTFVDLLGEGLLPRACAHCHGTGGFAHPARMGIGQWSRCEHEILFVCTRRHEAGDIALPEEKLRPRSVLPAPRGEHSEKPERAWRKIIEPISRSVMPGVGGIEWNCRAQRSGWGAYGRLDGESQPLRFVHAARA